MGEHKVLLLQAGGSVYSEDLMAQMDFASSYLKTLLDCLAASWALFPWIPFTPKVRQATGKPQSNAPVQKSMTYTTILQLDGFRQAEAV